MTTLAAEPAAPTELEPDNSTRLAIFDALSDAAIEGHPALTADQLYERVIGRLRVLVPRELHNAGEHAYLQDKIGVCVDAGLLMSVGDAGNRFALPPDPQAWIRFPDDSIRRYTPGLIAARERLEAVNGALRGRFDVVEHLPHHQPSSPEFRALVRSMHEHGFLKQFAVFRFPDGAFVDGKARVEAAAQAGVQVKWLDLEKLGEPDQTKARRRDTPINRVLLALDSNATRITDEDRNVVLAAVADAAGRAAWEEIARDLDLTQAWRQAVSRSYTPIFDARSVPFQGDANREVLVTPDHKIQMRSLVRAAGLPEYSVDKQLKYWVHAETARVHGSGTGRPALFASATDLLSGIESMLADRREHKRKPDPKWDELLDWLRAYARDRGLAASRAAAA